MSSFIKNPNLPEGKVSTVICGTDDKSILSFLKKQNISVLKNAKNPCIDPCVSTHADMAALYLGDGHILLDKKQIQLKSELSELGYRVSETAEEIKESYPGDIKLNFTLVADFIMGRISDADVKVVELTEPKKKINVRQGYCKCSTLVVGENSIITDDASIHRKVLENGFDSLLISKGDICLDGHGYGFIGGASGKIDKDTVVFFGDVTKHSDFQSIRAFLTKYGCSYVCTDDSQLRDIGGIVALKEIL